MPTSLQGIAKKAASQQGSRVRNLDGRLDEDFLQQCWRDIRQDAAAGVDQVRAQASEPQLAEHLHHLVARLKQQRYRATLVRRHDMPTGDGTQRPLGIPAVADTLLPLAVARLLDAIYAQDFRRCRDGYRPQGGALEAVDTLTLKLQCGRDAWVVAADGGVLNVEIHCSWRPTSLCFKSSKASELSRHLHFQNTTDYRTTARARPVCRWLQQAWGVFAPTLLLDSGVF
jgi:hypothetical protein